ncbi:Pkinase-domain-containing protein [Neoconidiobolus thromboides FSU 785]|nr:Pkinase-domain-containing protein [Neoconidiobolus thromboides FSU 785]
MNTPAKPTIRTTNATNAPAAPTSKSNKDWPELDSIIINSKSKKGYKLGGFLGEGGFAKCYEVVELNTHERYCCKAIYKKAIKNSNERAKIRSEIKINGNLIHPHIVKLQSCFEDDNYVYIILEICDKKSMMELLKRRKRLTEEETKYYMLQIIDGMEHCLSERVIHRDLKLGNIFITKDMNLKIGDFGLAAQLTATEDRKKTICGTPNYIAPEVLFDKSGHSFSADMWSIGVIIYTLIIGVPPFQTSTSKKLYSKIKAADFSFPDNKPISEEAKDIIRSILNTNPAERPTFKELRAHPFFTKGFIPKKLPLSCLDYPPKINELMKEQDNLKNAQSGEVVNEVKQETVSFKTIVNETNKQSIRPVGTVNGMIWNKPNLTEKVQEINKIETNGVSAVKEVVVTKQKVENNDDTSKQKLSSETLIFEEIIATFDKLNYLAKNKFRLDEINATYENITLEDPNFINKWVDHGDQYGLGFELADATRGIFFKDSTTMIMAPDHKTIEYLFYPVSTNSVKIQCEVHSIDNVPSNLYKKYKIFLKYSKYMEEKLSSAIQQDKPLVFDYEKQVPGSNKASLPYITKFLRTRRSTLFRLTNKVVQMNFKEDHVKLILSQKGYVLSIINQNGILKTYKLMDILTKYYEIKDLPREAQAVATNQDFSSTPNNERPELDYIKIYDHLDYIKGVLYHVVSRKQGKASNNNEPSKKN